MIPRIRPYFIDKYFNIVSDFDPDIPRSDYCIELARQLQYYYPNAQKFGFFNYGRTSFGVGLDILNIHKNDEIIIPCFTCSTILDPILKRGIIPKLVDINIDFSMNPDQVKRKITKNTKAILVTHFFGIPANLSEIKEIAEKKDLYIIEDCAHTFCQQIPQRSGSIGDVAFTSLGNDKPLSIGNGSVLIVNNPAKAGKIDQIVSSIPNESKYNEKCSFLSLACFNYATEPVRYNNFIGVYDFFTCLTQYSQRFQFNIDHIIRNQNVDLIYNFFIEDCQKKKYFSKQIKSICNLLKRTIGNDGVEKIGPKLMNTFSLNLLLNILPEIEKINELRAEKGCIYVDNLSGNTELIFPQNRHVPYLRYSILCKKPKNTSDFLKKLRNENFEVGNFNWAQPINKILGVNENYKISEYLCKNIINLPCYPSLNNAEIYKITQILNQNANYS